jgi:hypothetical protein
MHYGQRVDQPVDALGAESLGQRDLRCQPRLRLALPCQGAALGGSGLSDLEPQLQRARLACEQLLAEQLRRRDLVGRDSARAQPDSVFGLLDRCGDVALLGAATRGRGCLKLRPQRATVEQAESLLRPGGPGRGLQDKGHRRQRKEPHHNGSRARWRSRPEKRPRRHASPASGVCLLATRNFPRRSINTGSWDVPLVHRDSTRPTRDGG